MADRRLTRDADDEAGAFRSDWPKENDSLAEPVGFSPGSLVPQEHPELDESHWLTQQGLQNRATSSND